MERRNRYLQFAMSFGYRSDGASLEEVMQLECGARGAAQGFDSGSIFLEKFEELVGGSKSLIAGRGDTFKEEIQPCFPVAIFASGLEQIVIEAAMAFEEQAQ